MEFKGIKKVHEGKYIHRYDVAYETADGQEIIYETVSHNRDMTTFEELNNMKSEAVVMILTDETGDRLLLNREYRLAMGKWVYNFPAGLIDPGEDAVTAGRRELLEETGLELLEISDVLDRSYTCVGFSNEMCICIFGTARGEFSKSVSSREEIEPGWYTRQEVKDLLGRECFAARTQAFCYLWAREKGSGSLSETD